MRQPPPSTDGQKSQLFSAPTPFGPASPPPPVGPPLSYDLFLRTLTNKRICHAKKQFPGRRRQKRFVTSFSLHNFLDVMHQFITLSLSDRCELSIKLFCLRSARDVTVHMPKNRGIKSVSPSHKNPRFSIFSRKRLTL